MSIEEWKSLHKLVDVSNTGYETLPKPTDVALDQLEKQLGVGFPASYRDFVKVFGAGRLNGFDFYGPSYRQSKDHGQGHREIVYDFHDFTERFVNGKFRDGPIVPGSDIWHQRMLFFTHNPMSRNIIGWDVRDVRDSRNSEYGVYEVDLDDELEYAPVLIAKSFSELIRNVCLGDEATQAWRGSLSSTPQFEPAIDIT